MIKPSYPNTSANRAPEKMKEREKETEEGNNPKWIVSWKRGSYLISMTAFL